MIETILAKIGLPILISFVSQSLKGINSPIASGAVEALEKVDEALKAGQITSEQLSEANRHLEEIAKIQSEEMKLSLSEINQTIRSEVVSQDLYVRRMRPTFGYIMAITWAAQMLAIAYIIIFDTSRAGFIINAIGSLTAIWGVGLSVLGIYVYKRSEDKKISNGKEMIFWDR